MFSLDDFGTGLSSFAYLKNLQVDYLKIDGGFVRDILKDPVSESMVGAINQVGQAMNLKTVAEFVENDAIRQKLANIGVDYGQGYGIDKPSLFRETSRRGAVRLRPAPRSRVMPAVSEASVVSIEDGMTRPRSARTASAR